MKEGEEKLVDTEEVKRDIQQRMIDRPSAMMLTVIRGFCAGLIYTAPKVPRTLQMIRELHARATKWAALGWEPAILFCIYMTQTQVTVAHDLGETSKAVSIAKNTLEMIAAHHNQVISLSLVSFSFSLLLLFLFFLSSSSILFFHICSIDNEFVWQVAEDNKKEDGNLYEEQDFAFGMLKCNLECKMYIGLYLDFPLAKYSEAQKWYEDLLSTVDSHIGSFLIPIIMTKKKNSSLLLLILLLICRKCTSAITKYNFIKKRCNVMG